MIHREDKKLGEKEAWDDGRKIKREETWGGVREKRMRESYK